MKKIKIFFTLMIMLVFTSIANAQGGDQEPVGKFMCTNRRSYVVIAVMLTILIGLVLYVIRLDSKIRRFEKENK